MTVGDLCRDYRFSWLGGAGPECDVVLASRVELARNFDRLPFPGRADRKQLAEAQARAASVLGRAEASGLVFDAIGMEGLTQLEREALAEKRIVSPDLIRRPEYRSVYVSRDARCAVMVNEEDHLRIQCMAPGLALGAPLELALRLDDAIEARTDIAFDERMGYLTSCPTNLGTGLRASVFLHLPGLAYTRNMEHIIHISQQLGLSVRGLYGEGGGTAGHLFVVSNQSTIGFTEQAIVENLAGAAAEMIAHERRARKALAANSKDRLEDAAWRAYGVLRYARSLGEDEGLEAVSRVKLGCDLGILRAFAPERFAELLTVSRPGYLKHLAGSDNLSKEEIDRRRAGVVRRMIADERPEQG